MAVPSEDRVLFEVAGGRYAVLGMLGEGGAATVYRTFDRDLGVERAIKLRRLRKGGSDVAAQRLDDEARVMARLQHPRILPVYDAGRDGTWQYVVMKLAPGGSVAARIQQRGPMGPRSATQLMIPVLEALAEAHQHGVVHRDVKPQNILLDENGDPWLADWGIARLADRDLALTRTGIGLGSIATMAPEQRRDAHEVGPEADVYASGATLYHLLTRATPVDLFAAGPGSERWANLPESLVAVLRRACAWNAADRYPSATAMVEALREIVDDLPDTPIPTPATSDGDTEAADDQAPAPRRRGWLLVGAGLAGAALFGAATLALVVGRPWAEAPAVAPPDPAADADSEPEPPPTRPPKAAPPPPPVERVEPEVGSNAVSKPVAPPPAGTSDVAGVWRGSLEGTSVRLVLEGPAAALRGGATLRDPDGTTTYLTVRGTLAGDELTLQADGQGFGDGRWSLRRAGERWTGEVVAAPSIEAWNLSLSRAP